MKNRRSKRGIWVTAAVLAFLIAAACAFSIVKDIWESRESARQYEEMRQGNARAEEEGQAVKKKASDTESEDTKIEVTRIEESKISRESGKQSGGQITEVEEESSAKETAVEKTTVVDTKEKDIEEKDIEEKDSGDSEKKIILDIPIDFESLEKENPDIYAWITIEGTSIDYPVARSLTDDTFYMDHGIDRAENRAGAIFTERLNKLDFSDPHTVIYGHNMRDGSMFGGLHEYEDNSYFEKHREIKVYTSDAIRTYKIFAAYLYDDRHLLKSFDCSEKEIFRDYLKEIEGQRGLEANIDKGMKLTTDDRILTLSTCDGAGADTRYLVQAVLIEEQKQELEQESE